MAGERWATFDCYGTMIDWNAGIERVLARLFGSERAPRLLERYHELEPEAQDGGYRTYREVLSRTLARLADDEGRRLAPADSHALADSLPEWPPFPEVAAALSELRRRGWRLPVLSNCDRDLIRASLLRIGVPFERAVGAEEVRSYKPAHRHWERFFELTGATRARHVHVAASLFHDIAPARALGLTSVWINRLGEKAESEAARELSDCSRLPQELDALVPARVER